MARSRWGVATQMLVLIEKDWRRGRPWTTVHVCDPCKRKGREKLRRHGGNLDDIELSRTLKTEALTMTALRKHKLSVMACALVGRGKIYFLRLPLALGVHGCLKHGLL